MKTCKVNGFIYSVQAQKRTNCTGKSDFFNQLDYTSKPETPKSLNRLVFQLVSAALGRWSSEGCM